MLSFILGLIMAAVPFVFALPWYVAVCSGMVGFLGLPRWIIKFLRTRRQNIFLNDFADAIDVMVRGLKSGLPVTDAMRVIASESGPPVGPEFNEIVEGQRIGISVDQGVERMVERMPLAEVNFLAIVMAIQAKTGGNLSEALGNLSKVLRDRKKMKAKIRAVSQEAKSSAAIIGSLPFIIMGALTVLNPEYLNPLFYTRMGNILIIGSGIWMGIGVLVMRKMINFEIWGWVPRKNDEPHIQSPPDRSAYYSACWLRSFWNRADDCSALFRNDNSARASRAFPWSATSCALNKRPSSSVARQGFGKGQNAAWWPSSWKLSICGSVFEAEGSREMLRQAGMRSERHLITFLAMRLIAPIIVAIIVFIYSSTVFADRIPPQMRIVATVVGLVFGFYLPSII